VARLALLAVLLVGLAACGGSEEPAAEPEPAPTSTAASEPARTEEEPGPTTTDEEEPETVTEAAPERLPGLPRFTAGYSEWAKLATDIPPRDADPHLGTKDVFASRERKGGLFPPGTVIVKQARRPGKDFIGLVATMRKVEGADPAHNDWVFVEYARESPGERFTELASGEVCWTCHMGAEQADYVWVLAE
jgi:Cytochrome P460